MVWKYDITKSKYDDYFSNFDLKRRESWNYIYIVEDWMDEEDEIIQTTVTLVEALVIDELYDHEYFELYIPEEDNRRSINKKEIFFLKEDACKVVAKNLLKEIRKNND